MVAMTLVSAILSLALWLPGRSNGAMVAFAVLVGFSSGAGIGLGPVLIASISPMSELGTRVGTILAIAAVGTVTSPCGHRSICWRDLHLYLTVRRDQFHHRGGGAYGYYGHGWAAGR